MSVQASKVVLAGCAITLAQPMGVQHSSWIQVDANRREAECVIDLPDAAEFAEDEYASQFERLTEDGYVLLNPEDDDAVVVVSAAVGAGDEAAGAAVGASAFATPSKLLSEYSEHCKAECQSLREVCNRMRTASWMHDWSKSIVYRQVASFGGAARGK